jgi:transcriptional regulator with XRE-family HTH domain
MIRINHWEDVMIYLGENLKKYRVLKNLTQEEVAEHLSITPQSVSKWERAESIPDITVLKSIADLFGVTVDYLLEEEHKSSKTIIVANKNKKKFYGIIIAMAVLLVYLIGTIFFVSFQLASYSYAWLSFIWCTPVAFIVWLVLNSIWLNRKLNYIFISFLLWSLLCAIHITLLVYTKNNLWLTYGLGAPGQIIIILWSRLRTK